MVDVSDKEETLRKAVAVGALRMQRKTLEAILQGTGPKGDVLQVARLAGLQAGKRTGELIPLCHILPGVSVEVDLSSDPSLPGIRARVTAAFRGRTGVEMEALTGTAVALMTVYDMVKSMDRGMVLEEIRLISKEGGRSGTWQGEGA